MRARGWRAPAHFDEERKLISSAVSPLDVFGPSPARSFLKAHFSWFVTWLNICWLKSMPVGFKLYQKVCKDTGS